MRMHLRVRRTLDDRLRASLRGAGDLLARVWVRWARAWRERRGFRAAVVAGACVLMVSGSAGGYWLLRGRAAPDMLVADLPDALDFAIASEDFNRLPLEERLRLLEDLFRRLRGMSQGDSVELAAFASGLTGKLRAQLERNARKLAVDVWVDQARRYANLPKERRADFLDQSLLELVRLGERVSGFESGKTDSELLGDAKKNAQRDAARAREADVAKELPGTDVMATRIMREVQKGSEFAPPAERANMSRFMRDMTRNLRGQDLDTGGPKKQ
jgi:hypothetical protein